MIKKKTLVILSGPSCVGKGPLRKALEKYHPEIKYAQLVLCNSRKPRLKKSGSYEVHGVDYYFLPQGLFSQLDRDRFIVGNVRSDIQAIDMDQARELLKENDLILAEVYYTLGRALMEWARSQSDLEFDMRSVLICPLSDADIEAELRKPGNEKLEPRDIVCKTMNDKLYRRGEDSPEKIIERASSAFEEIEEAKKYYTDLILNHAGEDAKNEWSEVSLGPEAQRVLNKFVEILTR
jgi:guanylate kinase